jgi:hypothetical protein
MRGITNANHLRNHSYPTTKIYYHSLSLSQDTTMKLPLDLVLTQIEKH